MGALPLPQGMGSATLFSRCPRRARSRNPSAAVEAERRWGRARSDIARARQRTLRRAVMRKHVGSSFESFLEENGIKDEVELRAPKDIFADQIPHPMTR